MENMKEYAGKQKGFTLIELMIALVVLTLLIVTYIGATGVAQRNTEEMHERTIAIQNANQVIEQMRTVANTIPFPASVVNAYPDNGPPTGFTDLTNETITVSYCRNEVPSCPAIDTSANPLDVTITVTWQSYTRRQCTEVVQTYITQRGGGT